MFDRRHFLKSSSATALVGGTATSLLATSPSESPKKQIDTMEKPKPFPLFISTWKFGKPVNDQALATSLAGGSMLDAIEKGIHVAEADAKNASVGLGGIPASNGIVQLDACIMNGPDHNAGAVAGIEQILHPISVARSVMEKSRHVMLVGSGAQKFALEQGFHKTQLLTDHQKSEYEKFLKKKESEKKADPKVDEDHHDTITLIGLDQDRNVYGGCSTSGWGYKTPGRVGDSPIIGAGLYVDNEVGGAGATGIGENVMRYCASFQIVEEMRHGASPQVAIERVVARIVKKDPRKAEALAINFIAINTRGETGAAGTSKGFQFAVTRPGSSEVFDAKALSDADIEEGGNRF